MKKLDLLSTSEKRIFLQYVIPAMLAMLATNVAALVDTIFIGRVIGKEAITAITLIMPVVSYMISFAPMIGIGGSTLAGIHKGAKDDETSKEYFSLTFYLILIAGICMTGIIVGLHNWVPSVLNLTGTVANLASDYLLYVGFFSVFFLSTMVFSFFLRLDEKPVLVIVVTVIGMLINIVLDYVFIVIFGWGMKGAALATGTAQLVPSVIFFVFILRSDYWEIRKPHFPMRRIVAILFNGSSEMLSILAVATTGIIYNIVILSVIGELGVASYGIALQVLNVATFMFYGVSDGIQSPLSVNFGAGQLERVRRIRRLALGLSIAIGMALGLCAMFFGKEMASLFVKDFQTVELAAYVLKFYAVVFPVVGVNMVITSYYTALNQPIVSIILATARSLVLTLLGLLIFPRIFGEFGLWLPICVTEYLTSLLVIFYLTTQPYGKEVRKA